jgi:hypothetical protein
MHAVQSRKVKVNYESLMERTFINCKKWDPRLQKSPPDILIVTVEP